MHVTSYSIGRLEIFCCNVTERRSKVVNIPACYCGGKVSTRRPTILTEIFVVFPYPYKKMSIGYPKIRLRPLSSTFFTIYHSLITLLFDPI
jgi:hypothetical protein